MLWLLGLSIGWAFAGPTYAPRVVEEAAFTMFGGGVSHDPVVVDGVAYLSSYDGLSAIAMTDGALIWFADGAEKSFLRPVVLERLVITAEWTSNAEDPKRGTVHAFDRATGAEVWTTRLNAWMDPAGAGDDLAILARTGDEYALVVLDASDGHERLRLDVPDAGYAQPVVADGLVLLATDRSGLTAYDADDGHVVWTTGSRGIAMSVPTCAGKRVFHTDSDGEKGVVRARDLETGDIVWTCPFDAPISGGFVVDGSRGYTFDWAGDVWAIDVERGEILWHTRMPYGGTRSVAVGDGVVFVPGFASVRFGTDDERKRGQLQAVSAVTGERQRVSQIFDHERITTPAVESGRVLVGSAAGDGYWIAWDVDAFLLEPQAHSSAK
ncbi:MAG: PQQ-binding-like beta-propeller repeat protein [Planctomycetes bacterium]|nr:PQQ-binding-like beta-propeller repeat protein [Planctomycetota bacterium]